MSCKISVSNRDGYNRWASFYDRYPNPTVFMDERVFPPLWQHLTGRRVLEIGCGTGRHTVKLAKCNQVTALDLSEGMLAQARAKLPETQFVHADFMSWQTPDIYDAVIVCLVLEHIKDVKPFFEKIACVLAPQGELFISELHSERSRAGVFAHFKEADETEYHLESYLHEPRAIREAATSCELHLVQTQEAWGTQELAAFNPKWERLVGLPMLQTWHFRKLAP